MKTRKKNIKMFIAKCFLFSIPIFFIMIVNYVCDPFNVFHYKNIRFTSSSSTNLNYVRTRYVLENPTKYNAFLFGSSRVGYLPKQGLPSYLGNEKLNWYNMTYSNGIPYEHLLSIKTLLKNNISPKIIIIEFDEISMNTSIESHKKDPYTVPYQIYEESKFNFFYPYLKMFPRLSIMKEVINYDYSNHIIESNRFYGYGSIHGDIFLLNEHPDMDNFNIVPQYYYTEKNVSNDLLEIKKICDDNNIELILFTSPIYINAYKAAVDAGYFNLLKSAAVNCNYYNFSSLNNYTTDPQFYYEYMHFNQYVGLAIEKIIFGSEEDKLRIRQEVGDDCFGIKVDSDNIDFVISYLTNQMENIAIFK